MRYSEAEMTKIARAEYKRGYKQAQKDIIELFKGDSIYSSAVIKFEISNME